MTDGRTLSFADYEAWSNRFAHLARAEGLQRARQCRDLHGESSALSARWCGEDLERGFGSPPSRRIWARRSSAISCATAKPRYCSLPRASLRPRARSTRPELALRRTYVATSFGDLAPTLPSGEFAAFEAALCAQPAEPIADQSEGVEMLYSSGTTGVPKGIRKALPAQPFGYPSAAQARMMGLYGIDQQTVYLSPAPLYHAAPLMHNIRINRFGGTSVVMEKFDALGALEAIERHRITHSQWVPTMFVRLLRLAPSERARFDLSSHRCAIHAAAPCPVEVKHQMIDWWGPILREYYGGSEGNGMTAIDTEQWLAHPGSVGRPVIGEIKICDDDGKVLPTGEVGTVYFAGGPVFEYHNDPQKTAASRHREGGSTLGDIGYLDDDGYLYLTDRKAFVIISGGVNIYPQESENVLLSHHKVLDVAVIGVPDEEFGEAVKAIVQPVRMSDASAELGAELIAFCKSKLSPVKCPRSVDFLAQLPRQENGKLYKQSLRDPYWKR